MAKIIKNYSNSGKELYNRRMEWDRFIRLTGKYEIREYRMMEYFIEELEKRKIQ